MSDGACSDEADSHAPVDLNAFCVSCHTTDVAAFSRRMLNKRGRHGDRTRRCRACVELAEKSAATEMSEQAAHQQHELEKRYKKLKKALRQIDELKLLRGQRALESNQQQKIEREDELRAALREAELELGGASSAEAATPARAAAAGATGRAEKRGAGQAEHLNVMPPFMGAKRQKKRAAGWGQALTSSGDAEARGVREIAAQQLPPGAPRLGERAKQRKARVVDDEESE